MLHWRFQAQVGLACVAFILCAQYALADLEANPAGKPNNSAHVSPKLGSVRPNPTHHFPTTMHSVEPTTENGTQIPRFLVGLIIPRAILYGLLIIHSFYVPMLLIYLLSKKPTAIHGSCQQLSLQKKLEQQQAAESKMLLIREKINLAKNAPPVVYKFESKQLKPLKRRMIKKSPGMKKTFDEFFSARDRDSPAKMADANPANLGKTPPVDSRSVKTSFESAVQKDKENSLNAEMEKTITPLVLSKLKKDN